MENINAGRCEVAIDVLPDDVLLNVFDCYLSEAPEVEAWHTLVHVCRQWRSIVFGSPHRLDLQIACTNRTPVREMLDIWPALPIFVSGCCTTTTCLDNIKAALEHNDRVCAIKLFVFCYLEEVFAALEEPFPVLRNLNLRCDPPLNYSNPLRSLGQSSRLRTFLLGNISVPELPKLLLSCTDLVSFILTAIPHSGHISPEELFTILSALTRLERVLLRFDLTLHSPSRRSSRRSSPPTRVVLPALTHFSFEGDSEYLEDVVSRIDAPLLHHLDVTFDQIVFDTPQLLRFISCIPKWQAPDKAKMGFDNHNVWIEFPSPTQISGDDNTLMLASSCIRPDRHFPCVVRFCRPPFFPLPKLEHLYIDGGQYSQERLEELPRHESHDIEITRWLELFQPFSTVKNLYLSKAFAPRIAPTLEILVGGRTTEALPTLQNIFLEDFQPLGPVHKAIEQFVAARQLSDHPIVIYPWVRTEHEAKR